MDKGFLYKKWKYLFLIYAFGVFSGCIYLNLLWRLQGTLFQNEWGMIFERLLAYSIGEMYDAAAKSAMWFLLVHILICILGITKIGKIFLEGIVLSGGFLTGAFETLLLLAFRLSEGAMFLGKILIAFFIYVVAIGSALLFACSMSSLKYKYESKSKKWQHIQWKKYFIFSFGTLFLHVVYIFIHTYVNYGKISIKIFFG